jgi:hypothetical protein
MRPLMWKLVCVQDSPIRKLDYLNEKRLHKDMRLAVLRRIRKKYNEKKRVVVHDELHALMKRPS